MPCSFYALVGRFAGQFGIETVFYPRWANRLPLLAIIGQKWPRRINSCASAIFVVRYSFLLLPYHEPNASPGVLVNELSVLTQGKAAARDIARARIRVKLDGILLSGWID